MDNPLKSFKTNAVRWLPKLNSWT